MRGLAFAMWGSGRGPIRKALPNTRVAAGAIVFVGCITSTGTTASGSICACAICAAWLLACLPPWVLLRACFVLGLAIFLPYFALIPLLPDSAITNNAASTEMLAQSAALPWSILLRGISGMLVCSATVSSLSVRELHDALLALPLPTIVSAILIQIAHQSETLLRETRTVAAAMAVRGASSGWRAALRVAFSLPRVWLPRIIARAEQVAAAMETRGFDDYSLIPARAGKLQSVDIATLTLATSSLIAAILVRFLIR